MSSESPIFIVACPRSGTTLLSSVLNSHSNIAIGAETHFFNSVSKTSTLNPESFLEHERIKDFCKLAGIKKEEFLGELNGSDSKLSLFEALMNSFSKKMKKPRWAEKTPQHLLCVTEILEFYPKAKIIYLFRDGRDNVNSLLKMPWRPPGLLNNARFWLQQTELGKKIQSKISSDSLISIKYEDLLREPVLVAKRVCEFIGEDFEDSMLDRQEVSSLFASWENDWKEKASKDFDQSRIGAWQDEMNEDDAAILNFVLKKRLEELGYQVEKPSLNIKQSLILASQYLALAFAKILRLFS